MDLHLNRTHLGKVASEWKYSIPARSCLIGDPFHILRGRSLNRRVSVPAILVLSLLPLCHGSDPYSTGRGASAAMASACSSFTSGAGLSRGHSPAAYSG